MGPTCALEAVDLNNVPLQFFLKVVSSPADVAEKADRIITMLPTSINAIEAYSGANGILKKVKKETWMGEGEYGLVFNSKNI